MIPAPDSSLDAVCVPHRLNERTARPADYRAENLALREITAALAHSSEAILERLVEVAMRLCGGDSAALSLEETDAQGGRAFRWQATTGRLAPLRGNVIPRDASPSGTVVDRGETLLFERPERHFPGCERIEPPIIEALLAPFRDDQGRKGTLWVVSHGEKRFDAEDRRLLENVTEFAATALRSRETVRLREEQHRDREALARSEVQYRTLFESIDEGFCVCEMIFDAEDKPVDYRFLEINPAFERLTGIPAEAARAGRTARELVPGLEPFWFETYGRVARTGEPVRFVNGSEAMGRWFNVHASRIGGEGSVRVAIVFKEVTAEKRSELERERALKAAAESAAFLKLVTDKLPILVSYLDRDLRFRFANGEFSRFFGIDPSAASDLNVRELLGEENFARSLPGYTRALAGESVFSPRTLDLADGERHVESRYVPDLAPDGTVQGFVAQTLDVTARVEAERALATERARLDRTLATAEVATFDWDIPQDHVYGNPLLREFFGITAEDGGPIGDYFDAIHPEDRERVVATIRASLETGAKYETEYRVQGLAGRQRSVIARGDTTLVDGKAIRLSGVLVDVTARREAEEALLGVQAQMRDEREKLRALVELAPSFIILLRGREFRYEIANEAARRLLGTRDLIGRTVFEVIPDIAAQGFLEQLRQVYERGKLVTFREARFRMPRATGEPPEEKYVTQTYQPLLDEHGRVDGILIHGVDVTDQVLARKSLALSEERFRAAIAAIAGTVWTNTASGEMRGQQPEWAALTGQSYEEYQGYGWAAAVHPEDAAESVVAWNEAVGERRPFVYEHRVRRHDGVYRQFSVRAIPVFEGGEIREWVGVHADVTEEREAAERLRLSEERFRIVARATRDAVWDWDLVGDTVWWNEGITDLFGYAREDTAPESGWWVEHIHPDDRERVVASIHEAIDHGRAHWRDEYRYLKADGGSLIVEDRGFALFNADGKPVRMLGAMTDVTESRRRATELAFLRELTETLIDLRDVDTIIQVAERMLGEFLGVSRCLFAELAADEETLTVRHDWSPHLPSVAGEYRLSSFGASQAKILREGHRSVVRDVERELTLGDGLEPARSGGIHASISTPILKEGRLVALLNVHQDAPRDWYANEVDLVRQVADRLASEVERARAETALRALNEELEVRVAQRTADLVAKNQELERFSYSVSHDMRTPMRAIVANASIVMEEEGPNLSEDGRHSLTRLAAAANRMGHLIDDLLGYARLGVREVRRESVDLSALMREVGEEIVRERPECMLQLEVAQGMRVVGDPTLLGVVVRNLLDNACKYRKPGMGAKVEVGRTEDAFFVRDHGIGFDMRYVGRLFRVFERLHRDEEVAGTGIGLANVARAVERMNGRAWAEGEVGVGATFWFTLPSP